MQFYIYCFGNAFRIKHNAGRKKYNAFCGVVVKCPHALNAHSASTEAGWILMFMVSLKIYRAVKSVELISNVTFLSV